MARSSPGVQRMVSILNFFAEHPGQAFTLTDLVRALRLSRATCHALLAGLVDAGYLYRTNDKSYVLGPTLAAIGRIANEHFSPLQVAQPEMRVLADEYGAICSAFFREKNEVVVRARAAAVSHLGWSVPQGARMPLRAPFGAMFFAWASSSEAEAWIGQLDPPSTGEQRTVMLGAMAFGREHGYFFSAQNLRVPFTGESAQQVFSGQRPDYPTALLAGIKADQVYALTSVLAPVFDSQRQVAFFLGLMGFTSQHAGAEIERMGRGLREACDRITTFIAGKQP